MADGDGFLGVTVRRIVMHSRSRCVREHRIKLRRECFQNGVLYSAADRIQIGCRTDFPPAVRRAPAMLADRGFERAREIDVQKRHTALLVGRERHPDD